MRKQIWNIRKEDVGEIELVGRWTIGVEYEDINTVVTSVKMSGILNNMEDKFRKIITIPLFEDSKIEINSLFFDIKNYYEGVISRNGMVPGDVFFDGGKRWMTNLQLDIKEV